MLVKRAAWLCLYLSVVPISACNGNHLTQFSSTTLPGTPVVVFPNSANRVDTTLMLSKPWAQVAGVDGRVFAIDSLISGELQGQVGIDSGGNMGLHGSYRSISSRAAKQEIEPFTLDAVHLLQKTSIVTFRYRGESESAAVHVGFLAEDAPLPVTDREHRSMDLNNSISVTIAATKQLDARIDELTSRVDALRSQIRKLHGGRQR